MKRISAIMLLLMLIGSLSYAQDTEPASTEDESGDEGIDEEGIPADFNDFLKTTWPGLDPAGKHDIFNLKNPNDPDERYEYTMAMDYLVQAYMTGLDMGATISKLFDQYSRGEQGKQVTFKVLHAVSMLYFPPGQPNVSEAQKLLREVTQVAPSYAYPHFKLAQIEYLRFTEVPNIGPSGVLKPLDKALDIRPDFLHAIMMRARIHLLAQPPQSTEARELIDPWLKPGSLPQHSGDFRDLLSLYSQAHPTADLHKLIGNLLASKRLNKDQQITALHIAADIHMNDKQMDDAIADVDESLKIIDPASQIEAAIRAHNILAICWGTKAMELKRLDPELREQGAEERFDEFEKQARKHHRLCAEIERDHMPRHLRGGQAKQYGQYLYRNGELEEAIRWLEEYVDNTDMTGPQRSVLDRMIRLMGIELEPTEEGFIELYESHVAEDNMEALAVSLGLAKQKVQFSGENFHFKEKRSLNFFLGQLDNRLRTAVRFAAWMAGDTANQREDEDRVRTAEAIAARFEKETECNSEEQADLQEELSAVVRELGTSAGVRAAQARMARHFAKIIDDSLELDRGGMFKVVLVWTLDDFLAEVPDAPEKPRSVLLRTPGKAKKFLNDLADSLEAASKAEEPSEE